MFCPVPYNLPLCLQIFFVYSVWTFAFVRHPVNVVCKTISYLIKHISCSLMSSISFIIFYVCSISFSVIFFSDVSVQRMLDCSFLCDRYLIYQTRETVFHQMFKHRGKDWKYNAQRSDFDKMQGLRDIGWNAV